MGSDLSKPAKMSSSSITGDEVRHRVTSGISNADEGKKEVEKEKEKEDTGKHVYGRTPSGVVFPVPETRDMVSTILDPRVRKAPSDLIVLGVLGTYVGLCVLVLPYKMGKMFFCLSFIFWRIAYNGGIGWLLENQSSSRKLVKWAKEWKLFSNKTKLSKLIRYDLQTKMGKDYDFDKVPIEYNTWLVFRRVVDLILMCDFTTYLLFGLYCFRVPPDHGICLHVLRWFSGITLIIFNLWVKLDAHRVVHDYAWYWGDFFFLEDVELTFDGVFEMAPHPMYSVGYAGYYGLSLLTASYQLLAISLLAHACQFAFLLLVENPHIEKTYNSQETKKSGNDEEQAMEDDSISYSFSSPPPYSVLAKTARPSMIVFSHFDVTRISDWFTIILCFYSASPLFMQSTRMFCFLTALFWRLFHTIGLGIILHYQSKSKGFIRLYLEYGKTPQDAWEQWKSIYNASTIMMYTSLLVVGFKDLDYSNLPKFWLFKTVIGGGLVALQVWVSTEVYQSLGEYGWFFGDFFGSSRGDLTYSGIYRYLNNPERLAGSATCWAIYLITDSWKIFILSLIWTFSGIWFIQFIEAPHMQKLYGNKIRKEAGLTRSIKRVVASNSPPFLNKFQSSLDKVYEQITYLIEEFLQQAKPVFTDQLTDTGLKLRRYPAKLIISQEPESLLSLNLDKFQVEGEKKRYLLGEEISVEWKSDLARSKKDWIGIYPIKDNPNPEVTTVSSRGHWCGIDKDGFKGDDHVLNIIETNKDNGKVKFCHDALPWKTGKYELRYNFDGGHHTLTISQPIEIYIDSIPVEVEKSCQEIEIILMKLFSIWFSSSGMIVPKSIDSKWNIDLNDNGKFIKRLRYGINQLFGIDFHPQIFIADGNIKCLAMRIVKVKQVLQPFKKAQATTDV